MSRITRTVALGAAAALALSACGGGGDPFTGGSASPGAGGGGDGGGIVVGSANFPESALLAEIYAGALAGAGYQVSTQLNIGSREVYFEQVENGELAVFPEYNGGILFYLDPEATASTTEETNAAIAEVLPDSLEILDSSAAENKDSLTVTAETAEAEDLTTIEDLEGVAQDLTLGAPAEFETRPQGVPGLESTYGLTFAGFTALDPSLIAPALADGDIGVANLFTTDPAIPANGFVVLEDTENLFGAQNVTPLIHSESVDEGAREALNAVSAQLDTETLVSLVGRVVTDREDTAEVAEDWLTSAGLA
ncbi:ABC transporter substrate-binding protein [Allonocardiopsis opalescens]|uniref:Osmoprotectant transport system substrate-binding protein n=1 Tax=Allonocardiopsis opalescens TaxID=1144618 RepID=A0A2T0QDW5_9ACTN|nr:ABC transporter substrate-binding protein [Allonocardiopsis opalescens]PRY02098.1 osmoprotectant transport system substrate-binding protein [Allonocardiopsis opalescens]